MILLTPLGLLVAFELLLRPEVPSRYPPLSAAGLEQARSSTRPIAIVVTRRACPRCEALEEAAFGDPAVSSVLENRFLLLALDSDERPDVARALADALLLVPDPRPPTDAGLSSIVLTTPDLRAFDGTGLSRDGRPLGSALLPFLVGRADAWDADRSALELRAGLAAAALRESQASARPAPALEPSLLERPRAGLREAFDRRHGGFGLPPRRLPHGPLRLLLEEQARTGDGALLAMASSTLDAILGSSLRDKDGGFFREAAAEDWSLPVREKTLVDNALLLRALVLAHEATGRESYASAAAGVAGFLGAGLGRPGGGLGHAVAWGPAGQVRDDRMFAHASGLAIGALARSGRALERPADLRLATSIAAHVLERLGPPSALARWEDEGARHGPALLEDHAFLAEGLLDLHEASGESRWRDEARALLDDAVRRYGDPAGGGFYESAEDGEVRPVRARGAYDGLRPSANAIMVSALRRLGRATGETRYHELARKTALAFAGDLPGTPRGLETLAASVSELLGPGSAPARTAASEPAPSRVERSRATLEAAVEPSEAAAGSRVRVVVRMEVAPGFHVIAHRPFASGAVGRREAPDVAPLSLAFPGSPFPLASPQFPDGTATLLAGSVSPLLAHGGTISVATPLTLPVAMAPGNKRLRVRVVYQACDARRCESPEAVLLEAPLRVVAR